MIGACLLLTPSGFLGVGPEGRLSRARNCSKHSSFRWAGSSRPFQGLTWTLPIPCGANQQPDKGRFYCHKLSRQGMWPNRTAAGFSSSLLAAVIFSPHHPSRQPFMKPFMCVDLQFRPGLSDSSRQKVPITEGWVHQGQTTTELMS